MDRNVQELFGGTGSETGSDSDDDCEDIFTELSKEINNDHLNLGSLSLGMSIKCLSILILYKLTINYRTRTSLRNYVCSSS